MVSLVDIAQAIDKEKGSGEPRQQFGTVTETASKPLSLVEVAREKLPPSGVAYVKPLTLVHIARKADDSTSSTGGASPATVAASLQSLAQEINNEERARIDTAITKAATDVKHEKAQQRAEVLKAATTDVLREEEKENGKAQVASLPQRQTTVDRPATEHVPPKAASPPNPEPASTPPSNEHEGYSSFEDDDDEPRKKPQATKKPTKAHEEDNQSESGSEAGPEKTMPSDSPAAKEFLRAIYRGDTRRVREMMRDDDMDASTADQHGWSALHWAASQDQREILSVLLDKNARVNAVEHVNGWTALHLAVLRDALACAKKLLHAGAQPTIHDVYGDTAYDLLKAVKGKKKERWLQLLDAYRHQKA